MGHVQMQPLRFGQAQGKRGRRFFRWFCIHAFRILLFLLNYGLFTSLKSGLQSLKSEKEGLKDSKKQPFNSEKLFMGQLAYHSTTGNEVEAFSLTDEEWNTIWNDPIGTWLMPKTNWPAIPKVSIRGLRFFAHKSGYPLPLPKPKSYAHTRLQIDIVQAARSLGFKANLEVDGCCPDGTSWIADVLAESETGRKIVFEVQLSSQHLRDFKMRTEKYRLSGVSVCWLLPEKTVGMRLMKSIIYENEDYYRKNGMFLADCETLITFGLSISGKDKDSYPSPFPPLRFGRGQYIKRLELKEVIHGMMSDFPSWQEPDWIWNDKTG